MELGEQNFVEALSIVHDLLKDACANLSNIKDNVAPLIRYAIFISAHSNNMIQKSWYIDVRKTLSSSGGG